MANITYLPADVTVVGDLQDSLLEVALDNEVEIDHNCGGNCACTTCAVFVEQGAYLLSPMAAEERETLEENEKLLPTLRLACQSRIVEDGQITLTLHG
jgi:ferredoxin, 2Fe-2S